MAALGLLGVTWQRPWLALLLAVPVLIWLLAARRDRSTLVWTGTLALWSEAEPTTARSRAARHPPRAVRFLVAALAAAVLALAGPKRATEAGASVWTVVVDRSPSMYLPWNGAAGEVRIARALARARDVLDSGTERAGSVIWISEVDGVEERSSSAAVPAEWLAQPAVPQSEPPWSRYDASGVLWVTDRAPELAPRAAGWVACGGHAVPGFVAARGADRVEWDGAQLVERANAGARPIVVVSPRAAGPLDRVVRAWAEARGCDVVDRPTAGRVLEIAVEGGEGAARGGGSGLALRVERDGWSWEIGADQMLASSGEVWLRDSNSGRPSVAWQPGRVVLASGFDARSEPQGDPADFALSWAELFDRASVPPAGVVSLAERLSAGEPSERRPRRASAQGERSSSAAWLLAAVAALLSLAALSQRNSTR